MPRKRISKVSTSAIEEEGTLSPQIVSVFLRTEGSLPNDEECNLLVYYNGSLLLDTLWKSESIFEIEDLPVNLTKHEDQMLIADYPLIILLRAINVGGKTTKETDPLLHPDNRAGSSVDLFPLLLGEDQVYLSCYPVDLHSGKIAGCKLTVFSSCTANIEKLQVPFIMTMISAHCLPPVKEGTVLLSAIGLDDVNDVPYNFGMSISSSDAKKVVWALSNNSGYLSYMEYNIIADDKYIPEDLELQNREGCTEFYWNAMRRSIIDPITLREKLNSPLRIEIAGVPKAGKLEIRGRYMGFIDAGVLLQPGQNTVTTCVKLQYYREADIPVGLKPLLQLPPMSAKASARATSAKDLPELIDEHGHSAYAVIRFDIPEPLVPKPKVSSLYNVIGIPDLEGPGVPMDALFMEPPPKDPVVDMRKVRADGGALAVHKELSILATSLKENLQTSSVAKRTAANRLLMKVRSMIKQFPPEQGWTMAEWQDTVTAQHTATRRAVLASFEPHAPPRDPLPRSAETRSRMAGDDRIADYHMSEKNKLSPKHPRTILSNTLRALEDGDSECHFDLLNALRHQVKNRYILWTFGAQEFDKSEERVEMAIAALQIAAKGDNSDGTTNTIGLAALHSLYHHNGNKYAGFAAAKKMRKAFELPRKWKKVYKNWVEISGQEESCWMPSAISENNPFTMAATLFLCFRCYNMTDRLLLCAEEGCLSRGSRLDLLSNVTTDNFYIRAAYHLLRKEVDKAVEVTNRGIKEFGPSATMLEMLATCLLKSKEWDEECLRAVEAAERAGAEINPSLLLRAALFAYKTDPVTALQRAARCHKLAPNAFSALTLAKIYDFIGNANRAERWGAAAVKLEPLLSDGWAFLCILALRDRNSDLARHLYRTAKQIGPISEEMEEEIQRLKKLANIEILPEVVLNISNCYCTDCY